AGVMSEVLRTDLLDHAMNAGKERKVFELLRARRSCALLVGWEQWRLFFETGRFNKNHRNEDEAALEPSERVQPVCRAVHARRGSPAPARLCEPAEGVVRPRAAHHEGRDGDPPVDTAARPPDHAAGALEAPQARLLADRHGPRS